MRKREEHYIIQIKKDGRWFDLDGQEHSTVLSGGIGLGMAMRNLPEIKNDEIRLRKIEVLYNIY
jgi:hypothetical protein